MELEECIKDNFDESLRVYIQSQEYTRLKQQEDRLLSYLQAGLSDMQKQQLGAYMDATTDVHSALASQDYVNGVVDGIAVDIAPVEKFRVHMSVDHAGSHGQVA